VTVRGWSIVTVHPLGSVPVQSPDQVTPVHWSMVAASGIVAPGANAPVQSPGQSIPAGFEVTWPGTFPATFTLSV
jgi:hypothetical protein